MAWRNAGSAARSFAAATARAPSLRSPTAALPRLRPSPSSSPGRRFSFSSPSRFDSWSASSPYTFCVLLSFDLWFWFWSFSGIWERLVARSLSCLCTVLWLLLSSPLITMLICVLSASWQTVPSDALVKIANYSPFVSFITLLRVSLWQRAI